MKKSAMSRLAIFIGRCAMATGHAIPDRRKTVMSAKQVTILTLTVKGVPRGYVTLEIDAAQRQKPIHLEIRSNPRRPVHRLALDCSPFGNKTRDGAAAFVQAAVKLIQAAEALPQSVIDLRLTGRLNLNRIALDQAMASNEIETQAGVFAVAIDVSGLNVGETPAGGGSMTEQFSREELEKAAIRAVVAEKHLWGLDHRDDEFASLFYQLKESVRLRKTGSELAEQIGRSPLLDLICASNLPADENRTANCSRFGGPGMIVESVRLKNIKSYGEGSEGNGITIFFLPGTNRIAGKNGHGKTTLIESLGYALFLTEPVFEENFQLETYFLRAGKKAAEIDVTFNQLGEIYRIERGLGPAQQAKEQSSSVE